MTTPTRPAGGCAPLAGALRELYRQPLVSSQMTISRSDRDPTPHFTVERDGTTIQHVAIGREWGTEIPGSGGKVVQWHDEKQARELMTRLPACTRLMFRWEGDDVWEHAEA